MLHNSATDMDEETPVDYTEEIGGEETVLAESNGIDTNEEVVTVDSGIPKASGDQVFGVASPVLSEQKM